MTHGNRQSPLNQWFLSNQLIPETQQSHVILPNLHYLQTHVTLCHPSYPQYPDYQ
jgi:hypothetical protein